MLANPIPFATVVVLVCGFTWSVASIYFTGQIATAKGQAELAEKQRDDFKSKLSVSSPDEAKTKIDRLEGELAGLNKILGITVGKPWPPLSSQEIADLSVKLMSLPKHPVQLMYLNQLGKPLAETLYQAFIEAGWLDEVKLMDGGGNHLGIIAGAGADKAAAVKQAIESATKLKVSLDKPNVPEWGGIYLFVGINSSETN